MLYERPEPELGTDFMLVVTYGNFAGQGDLVTGNHVPVPIVYQTPTDEAMAELQQELEDEFSL
jgi:hypothetical protein